jgi:tricorn protease
MTTRKLLVALLGVATLAISPLGFVYAESKPSGGMLRYPDVSATHIVFSYANDLWLVSREGGMARPLASPVGPERFPRFSADGQMIAFEGNYDGGRDLYMVPAAGGIPTRLTYHPAREVLCDWTPDGQLLYSTNGFAGLSRVSQLYTTSLKNPLPKKLAVAYGTNGAISSDGVWLAYTPYSRDTRTWKRYRGGMASDIWLFHLKKRTAKKITDFEGTDSLPMWHGQSVYYLSDDGPSHRLNIWSYDTATGARRQVTKFADFDVKWPSIGPGPEGQGEVVFQYGAELRLLDLATGQSRGVEVTIPGDRPQLRAQAIDVKKFVRGGDISPTGKRVVVEARGDIWSLPAKNGSPRNMTRTSGVAERDPSWSPDGRWIAYFADITGEYELYVKQSDGKGETRRLTNDGEAFRMSPVWSPDSKHIVFSDKTGSFYLYSFDAEKTVKVDQNKGGLGTASSTISWSHDSKWIAYDRQSDEPSGTSSIWLYSVADGKRHQISDDFFQDSSPTFDRKGQYLFYTSNRSFSSPVYEDLGTTFAYVNTGVLICVPLRDEVKYPFLAKSDEEPIKSEKKEEKKEEKPDDKGAEAAKQGESTEEGAADDKKDQPPEKDDNKQDEQKQADDKGDQQQDDADTKKTTSAETKKSASASQAAKDKAAAAKAALKIDLDGISRRAFQLPVKPGTFSGLVVNDKGHLLYARRGPRGLPGGTTTLMLFDLADPGRSEKTVVSGVTGYAISADGKKMLVKKGEAAYIIATAPGQKLTAAVPMSGMTAMINPREEWKQLFMDAWRIERDYFYDPNMHGVDWLAVRKHYETMLDDCVSREDVGYVISEMIAEINVGHAYYRGGDVEDEPRTSVGLLGCAFTRHQGAYRIGRLYEGAAWDVDARNPLRRAGVKTGEYLLAVNRVPLDLKRDPWAAFQGMAGRTVVLTVSSEPRDGEKSRDVVIKLLSSDTNLRYRGWIEHNRRYVEKRSKGKVGYIYVPNTGIDGQNDLFRQFAGQRDKQALIIDDRWNGGGQIPTRFIELLNRPVTNYWARRDGHDMMWPPDSHQGPKCMLINGLAGSGGDMFPALFRQAGIGKLVGMRTWGGLVGISGNPSLIDGGSVTAPTFAYYEKDGTWGIEGHGVDPDIEVVDDPALLAQGKDPQLDAAIKLMLEEIKQHPYQKPDRPAYPDRSKFGIAPEDK